ncbi:MAG: hypothetical protein R6X27_15565 [Candidatus Desulfacyla sp.]
MPQRFWPQKDIQASGLGGTTGTVTVLIASRSSEFKELLVAELQQQLSAAGIQQKTVGVEDLKKVDAADYAAVVVINTCLAWGLDHDVETFLSRQRTTDNVILLTTSGDGIWLPAKKGRDFDAVSGASIPANVNAVAGDLFARIENRLKLKSRSDTR